MTFDRSKILAEGGTYHSATNPLIECTAFIAEKIEWASVSDTGAAPMSIKEDANLPKRMVIEGVFQRADVRNANQRVYPRSLWERILGPNSPVQKRIAEKAMIGHLEHPETGATDLNKGAIRIEKVWMESDGTVKGRALVYNTPEGQRVQEYAITGTKLGISSRGTGTVDAKGHVCEDYGLETWDMVYNPSTHGAHPAPSNESIPAAPIRVVENANTPDTIPNQQVKPMSLSKRIAEARHEASQFLAVDPKRLTKDSAKQMAESLLDLRVKVAKEFVGEDRVEAVTELMAKIEEQRKACEDFDGGYRDSSMAPEGQVPTGLPGGADDILSKAVTTLGAGRAKAEAIVKSVAAMIAANLGKIPQIQAAVESAIADAAPAMTEAKATELKSLLGEAKETIISMTEREEAATAIIDEMTQQVISLQGEMAAAQVREDKAAKIIADLTSTAGKTEDAKTEEVTDKPVTESTVAPKPEEKPAIKTLAERIAESAKKSTSGSALPESSKPLASDKDAGEAKPKTDLTEGAHASTGKSSADVLVKSGAIKRLTESQGRFK